MTALWTSAEVAAATGGVAGGAFEADAVAFDSREVAPGTLFVALAGAQTDGHRFVDAAFGAGAAGAIVAQPVAHPHVHVGDTAAALVALGRAARARAACATVIGVTGSVGKTSVKEALRTVFEAEGPTHASVKSYNNHTGVPLSLARMPAATRWAIFEMGMNHAGEIAALTRQVRPHVALVTTVGVAHIENFAGPEGIADAKAEIFAGLSPGGTAVIPADSRWRDRLGAAVPHGAQTLTFGERDGDVRALGIVEASGGTAVEAEVAGTRLTFRLARIGRHHVHNALAVLATVHAAGGDIAAAARRLETLAPLAGRGRVFTTSDGVAVIDEAYNANPDSMAAALDVLAAMPARGVKYAVLGAMRELGVASDRMHADLAAHLPHVGHAILVGDEMRPLQAVLPPGHTTLVDNVADALAALRAMLHAGDLVLVKGSNGVGLSALVAALERGD